MISYSVVVFEIWYIVYSSAVCGTMAVPFNLTINTWHHIVLSELKYLSLSLGNCMVCSTYECSSSANPFVACHLCIYKLLFLCIILRSHAKCYYCTKCGIYFSSAILSHQIFYIFTYANCSLLYIIRISLNTAQLVNKLDIKRCTVIKFVSPYIDTYTDTLQLANVFGMQLLLLILVWSIHSTHCLSIHYRLYHRFSSHIQYTSFTWPHTTLAKLGYLLSQV